MAFPMRILLSAAVVAASAFTAAADDLTALSTGWVELRLARHGELFTVLHRADGATDWTIADQVIRPDLTEVRNVGLTASAD